MELLFQIRGLGRFRRKRANYADINLIVRRKNHKRQSVPVVVPIKIDTTPSFSSPISNRKITKMGFSMELDLSCKRHVASEHNRKQERVDIE